MKWEIHFVTKADAQDEQAEKGEEDWMSASRNSVLVFESVCVNECKEARGR